MEIIEYHETAAMILSVPAWLEQPIALVSRNERLGPKYIPLTQEQKTHLRSKVKSLEIYLSQKPDHKRTLSLIAEFILAVSNINFSENQVAAKTTAFMLSLAEFPAWMIEEAIYNWHRGVRPEGANKSFPQADDLREATINIQQGAKGRIIVFNRLLEYSSLPEYSKEHQETMIERLKGLFRVKNANA